MSSYPLAAQAPHTRADFPPELARLIKHEAGARLADHGKLFLDSFTEDAVMEFPFDPGGGFTVQGQKAIRDLFEKVDRSIRIEHVLLTRTYYADAQNSMLIEYTSKPRFLNGNVTFTQQYIAVVQFRAGRICLFREYINPLKPLEALGKYPPATK